MVLESSFSTILCFVYSTNFHPTTWLAEPHAGDEPNCPEESRPKRLATGPAAKAVATAVSSGVAGSNLSFFLEGCVEESAVFFGQEIQLWSQTTNTPGPLSMDDR